MSPSLFKVTLDFWLTCIARGHNVFLVLGGECKVQSAFCKTKASCALSAEPFKWNLILKGDHCGLSVNSPTLWNTRCKWGANVSRPGFYHLACKFSAGMHFRHAAANDVVWRALRTSGVFRVFMEHSRLHHIDSMRSSGISMFAFQAEKNSLLELHICLYISNLTCQSECCQHCISEKWIRYQGALRSLLVCSITCFMHELSHVLLNYLNSGLHG